MALSYTGETVEADVVSRFRENEQCPSVQVSESVLCDMKSGATREDGKNFPLIGHRTHRVSAGTYV